MLQPAFNSILRQTAVVVSCFITHGGTREECAAVAAIYVGRLRSALHSNSCFGEQLLAYTDWNLADR